MSKVEPRVIKIAETMLNQDAVHEFANFYTAGEWLQKRKKYPSNDAELLIELAGRACYKSFAPQLNPNLTRIRDDPKDYFANILRSAHGSVLEHASVTFAFLNVSRVFTHELVRHRAGTAISQESLRYVRPRDIEVWVPPDLNPVSKRFIEVIERIKSDYRSLETEFGWDEMNFERKKSVTSALRRILPHGIATNIIWTANHRTLRWVIEMRTAPSAEIEIRTVFGKVAEICIRDYPLIYGDFSANRLSDGTMQYIPAFHKV